MRTRVPDKNEIASCVRRVVAEYSPQRVVLFGSCARRTATPDSDVDLLVVMNHRESDARMAARIRAALHTSFPVDVLVRSPARLRQRLAMGDPFIKEILGKGVTLYEAHRAA